MSVDASKKLLFRAIQRFELNKKIWLQTWLSSNHYGYLGLTTNEENDINDILIERGAFMRTEVDAL